MGQQVVLQPIGQAATNFQNTIVTPVSLSILEPHLTAIDLKYLAETYPEGVAPVWGVAPGRNGQNRRRWQRMNIGDLVLFAKQGRFFSSGEVAWKVHSKRIATELWKVSSHDEIPEYIYFVKGMKPIDVPYKEFNDAAGYQLHHVIQGFDVLAEDKSSAVLQALNRSGRFISDKPKVADERLADTGRGGKGFGKGGRRGSHGDSGDTDNPIPEDFERLARMLARMSATLETLINFDYRLVDQELRGEFVRVWPRAANILASAIQRLLQEANRERLGLATQSRIRGQLQRAGMTGDMLRMKERSLTFYLDPVDKIISQPLTEGSSLGERVLDKLLSWTKPAFKVMNSILGSLLKAFPGMEVVKEVKEHVEAGYEIAEAKQDARE